MNNTSLFFKETEFGKIEVIETSQERLLFVDHCCQGRSLVNNPATAVSPYMVEILEAVSKLDPKPKNALVLGGGACLIPSGLQKMGIITDVVEYNAAMLEAAMLHFNYIPNGRVFIQDAIRFVHENQPMYDVAVIDLFNGYDEEPLLATVIEHTKDFAKNIFVNRIGPDHKNRVEKYAARSND